ncbi:MAG: family 20 glycosylhydrolase [Planctomycetota bacterium]|nr:family 20 glycosylhydrolase [Planctomycetota bacterium]
MAHIRRIGSRLTLAAAIVAALVSVSPLAAEEVAAPRPAGLYLIPWPKALTLQEGRLELTDASRIVAADDAVKPLAAILADEIYLATGRRLATATGEAAAGDIVLKLNKALKADADIYTLQNNKFTYTRDYAHTIAVSDRAVVEGFDYRAVAEGSATILQALAAEGVKLTLPRMTVKDWPQADFMAIMVDVGRQYITPEALRQTIQACRFYKVRYLNLHLSDDQGMTFPSKAFPKLGSRNTAAHGGVPPRLYTLAELTDLVAFGDARGVTLVPELETPGHSGAIRLAMPDVFDAPKTPGGPAWIAAMNIANDAMYPALDTLVGEICDVFQSSPYFHIGCDETQLGIVAGLPATKEYLAKHKMAGVGDLFIQHVQRMSQFVAKRGKKTIAWEGAPVPDSLKDDVIVMTWESNSQAATRYQAAGFTTITVPWNLGVPLVQWNMYICNGSFLKRTDKVIGASLPMWEMSTEALITGYLKGIPNRQERTWGPDNVFTEEEFTRRSAATEARVGSLIHTVTITPTGLREGNIFDEQLTVALSAAIKEAPIRYSLDGSVPTADSPLYTAPLKITDTARLSAAAFDSAGKMIGFASSASYTCSHKQTNLTTGKPVTASATEATYVPANAVDGLVLADKAWWAPSFPAWLQIDLESPHTLNRVEVFPFWDGRRYYQYTVELSLDAKTWTLVADMSKNEKLSTPAGDSLEFKPIPARYIRLNMLKNSVNSGVHVVEVRAYEAK